MQRILCSALFLCLAARLTPAASAEEFFVSPAGRDSNPGTEARPFATPQRAVEAVRASVARGLEQDVRVMFDAGTYELAAPLVFSPADSGTVKHSVTYAAMPGKTVVISGGRRITNWKLDGRKWTADLAEVRSGNWFFRLLVVNGERAVRARWPNEDGVLHLASVSDDVRAFTFDRALPTENLAGQEAELVVFENWSVSRARIVSSADGRLTTATSVGWIGHGDATTASPGKPAFIEHARACLDQPGEWFLDRKAGVLTYLARDGEQPTAAAAVAPVLPQLVKIAGTKTTPVRNLRFEGLRFEHADFALPTFGYSEIQAAHYGPSMKEPTHVQPVAIECSFAEGIRFENCRFAHLNASGIGFGPGCRSNAVSRCTLDDIGGNGVMIGWRGTGQLQSGADGSLDGDWANPTDAPTGNEVMNCVMQRCGADSRGGVGVFVAFASDTRIAHNEIHDLPYTGISLGYRWNTTPTSQVRCVAEYNHIYDVMKKLADGGGIYTLGYQPGTILRGNLIHEVHRSAFAHGGAPNNGFFIDEGSKGFLFESNVVYATSGTSVRFNQNPREGHTWKDNYFDGAATPAVIAEAEKRAGVEKGGRPEFFVFENGLKLPPAELAATLKALGYDGLSASGYEVKPLLKELLPRGLKLYNTYLTPTFDDATNALTGPVRQLIDDLQGSGAAIWIAIQAVTKAGKKFAPSAPEGDETALARLREIADYAEPRGVKLALYPHTWFWTERVEDGLRLAKKLNRPGVGATFNLCHWLKVEGARDPLPVLQAALPHLFFVSINGADNGDTKNQDWNQLIQTLDRGSYDVAGFLTRLREIGYDGPVGLQCYNVKGDQKENLKRSLAAWKSFTTPKSVRP